MITKYYIATLFCVLSCLATCLVAAEPAHAVDTVSYDPEFDKILSLDITELTVTSVSKTEEKISDAAAAIYVLTQKDLHRAGVTSIPEALRMVPGVDVAQINSRSWAVSVRGFNNALANKLLVLIDGRSVYTPVYSGVYWDTQDTMIEDIDRIEVIRGPGATLWGANAVNGVINIVTKKSSETQGAYVSASTGSKEFHTLEGRFGGAIDKDTHYRVYAKEFSRGSSRLRTTENSGVDEWSRLRTGFRYDKTRDRDNYTVQGDVYGGRQDALTRRPALVSPFTEMVLTEDDAYGGNALARWSHTISDTSNTSLQVYIDQYAREETIANQRVTTGDIDFQHVLKPTDRNEMVWGGGYRIMAQNVEGHVTVRVNPEKETFQLFNAFIQDQYALVPDKLFLMVGSKFEHNDYTGLEIQPTTRLSWKINNTHTAWAAVSRAVRVPSRVETDLDVLALVTPGSAGNPPNAFHLVGNRAISSEELTAYEVGYKLYPIPALSFDLASFYNVYDSLVTANPNGTPSLSGASVLVPFTFQNDGKGRVYGGELASNYNVTKNWQLAASYSYMIMDLSGEGTSVTNFQSVEHANPVHQFSIRSYIDLPHNLQWDNMLYYVHDITVAGNTLHLPANIRYDSRLSWEPVASTEISLIGRNLFNSYHTEFSATPVTLVGPSVMGTVAWRF